MIFGPVPAERAAGAVLAHTLRLGERGVLKKGRVLSAEDVERLAAAGYREVSVARLEEGDLGEDEAAEAVARAVAGGGLRRKEPFTGRCNLYAERAGVLVADRAGIDRLNGVDEAVTLACLAPYSRVAERTLVATVKVIPFGVPGRVVEDCAAVGEGAGPLVRVAPFRPRPAGLLLTELRGTPEAVLERSSRSQRTRLERLGCPVLAERRCAHDADAVAEALAQLREEGAALLLVLGASAIVDRRDVVPAGLEAAGGRVLRLGMPVDPGNLLLLGALGEATVVGVPGSARSLKPGGYDWVLERLVADLPVDGGELAAMGVGGLLKEPPGRPQPREGGAPALPDARPLRVGAVVLAAGRSSRAAPANKLLADAGGRPMVARVVDAVLGSSARPVVVVTGHEAAAVEAALGDRPVRTVPNPDFASGMASSLRAGLEALGDKVDGALVCLGDMPWIRAEHLEALVSAFDPRGERSICVPVHDRKRGNPVLWPARHFPEIRTLEGDRGARELLDRHADEVCYVPMPDAAVNVDVDTPDALARLRAEAFGDEGETP